MVAARQRLCPDVSRRSLTTDSPPIGKGLRARTLLLLALSAVMAAACGQLFPEPTPTPELLPVPLTAAASMVGGNALIARVSGELEFPGRVYVEYWAEGVQRLRSRSFESSEARYEAYAARLRPSTHYSFQVFSTDLRGRTVEGPRGVFTSGALPEGLVDARFEVLGGSPTLDVTFLEFRQHEFVGLAAFDGEGRVVWYFEPPEGEQPYVMARRPNGNIVYIAGFKGGTTALGIVEITPWGEEVARHVDDCDGFGPIHHEVQVVPDGRVMYLSREVLWEGYEGRSAPQEGDTIGIWDPAAGDAEVVWNIFDFISPAERVEPESNYRLPGHPLWGGCERDRRVEDWSHGNSAVMAEDGSVLVSLGHLNQIVSIKPDFQSVRVASRRAGKRLQLLQPQGPVLLTARRRAAAERERAPVRQRKPSAQLGGRPLLTGAGAGAGHGQHGGDHGLGVQPQPASLRRVLLQCSAPVQRQHHRDVRRQLRRPVLPRLHHS